MEVKLHPFLTSLLLDSEWIFSRHGRFITGQKVVRR
jgi:hypothetical protein